MSVQSMVKEGDTVVTLCPKCQFILDNWESIERQRFPYYHHEIDALEASAKGGCQLCSLFVAGFSEHALRTFRFVPELREISVTINKGPSPHYYHLAAMGSKDGVSRLRVATASRPDYSKEEQEVRPSTSCCETLDLAKSWLMTCTESHRACRIPTSKEFDCPTRLLSFGSGVVQLILTSEIPIRPPYATLSHCWGNCMPLKLVKGNFTNLRIGISDSELCKTFKDAIIIAKHLGLQYIWIDSLCIVQDDPEDWRRESAKMSSVYGYSTINIAATSAKDGTMGCFSTRVWKIRLPICIREQTRLWDFMVENPYEHFPDEPLLHRAWAFQERFLPARTLHFTSSQIFWECKENHWSETYPNVTLSILIAPSQFPKAGQDLSEIWINAVTLYSTGSLTYPTDRLVAISGVAKWLAAQTKDDYLVGMWRKDLERQLCWYIEQDKGDSSSFSRPEAYLAPSWSWASLTGSVNFAVDFRLAPKAEEMRANTRVRVLSAHIVLEDENYRFGRVESGVLRLVIERLFFGIAITNSQSGVSGDIVCPHGDILLRERDIYWDWPEEPKNKVYLLTVIHPPDLVKAWTVLFGNKYGIILEATDESNRAEYRRVGYYESWRVHWSHLDEDNELFYEEVEENGQKLRVISIV